MRLVEVNGIEFEEFPPLQYAMKLLLDPFRNHLIPASWWRTLMGLSRSPLVAETLRRPGSWQAMQIVYANERPVDFIDRLAVRYNAISMASRNRRKLVTAKLTDVLATMSGQDHIAVVGVGAGPGLHVQDAIGRAKLQPTQVAAYLIDRDSEAFEYGRQCARERGLESAVHFVQGDARDIRRVLPSVSPDVVKIVGLLEYLTDEQVTELLSALHGVMAPAGRLLTHGMVDRFKTGPFVARTFGLRHVHRTGDHVAKLLRLVGFQTIEVFEAPMRVYPVLVASR